MWTKDVGYILVAIKMIEHLRTVLVGSIPINAR